jgi:hypothetical protein
MDMPDNWDREDFSPFSERTESLGKCLWKKKNPWLLGEMFENRFPDARGREEG